MKDQDEEDAMLTTMTRMAGKVAAVAVAALLLSGPVHHVAAENQRPIDANVAGAVGDCKAGGGAATVDWTFGEDGEAIEAVVSCDKGGDDGWYLCADDEGYYCDGEPFELTVHGGLPVPITDAPLMAEIIQTRPIEAVGQDLPAADAPVLSGASGEVDMAPDTTAVAAEPQDVAAAESQDVAPVEASGTLTEEPVTAEESMAAEASAEQP
jgi:hypothetical protein